MQLTRFVILAAALSNVLATLAHAQSPAATPASSQNLALRTYTQDLTITFASPDDAARAKIALTPVLDGKLWAFSARWDDNSLLSVPVHDAMVETGLKGTFYINERRGNTAAEFANKLSEGGCDIGGHTQTHRLLNALLPNEVFYEILANRVQREVDTQRPMNSFAFPGGVWSDKIDPIARPAITQSVLRAGFHNCPYLDFVLSNPDMPLGAATTSHQVGPGDHVVDLPNYYKQVDAILSHRGAMIKQSYCIHNGVHARQQGAELVKLKEGFQHYAGNPDWWYCTMTDYAAYARNVDNAQITADAPVGAQRTYRITRPIPAELGSDVPMTIEVTGATVTAASGNGFKVDRVKRDDRVLFDVSPSANVTVPTVIQASDNTANTADPAYDKSLTTLKAWAYVDEEKKQITLTLQNDSSSALSAVTPTLRLPPVYRDGILKLPAIDLAAGEKKVIGTPLGEELSDADYHEGRAYYVAEVDYRAGDISGRVFATTRLSSAKSQPSFRDAVHMLGPMANDADLSAMVAASAVGADLPDLGQIPNLKWFTTRLPDRTALKRDRAVLYLNDPAWRTLVGKLDGKPQRYLLAMDFTTSEASKLKIESLAKPLAVMLNGQSVAAANEIDVPAGKSRIITQIETNDGRAVWTAYPLFVRITPAAGTLTFEETPAGK